MAPNSMAGTCLIRRPSDPYLGQGLRHNYVRLEVSTYLRLKISTGIMTPSCVLCIELLFVVTVVAKGYVSYIEISRSDVI